jgi:hypothetical protein
MNCDLNVYNHIPYKPLQDCEYKQKQKNLTKIAFLCSNKGANCLNFYMGYSKLYYALLDLKKVVLFSNFNVMIYIEFELLNYWLVYLVN